MRRTRSGFTLLEVILAITVVVMLLATLAGMLAIAFKSKRSSEDAVMSVRDIHSLGDILVQELESAAVPNANANVDPLAAQFNSTTTSTAGGSLAGTASGVPQFLYGPFYGDETSIAFYETGAEPDFPIQSDARYILFQVEPQGDGTYALVRHVEPNVLTASDSVSNFPSEQDPTLGLQPQILIPNIKGIKFQYFDGVTWNSTWDSTQLSTTLQLANTLPYAISIEIVLNPIHPGGEDRVLKRFATLWCADASVYAASTAAASSQSVTGGITGGFGP